MISQDNQWNMNILKDIPIKVSFKVGQRFNSQEKNRQITWRPFEPWYKTTYTHKEGQSLSDISQMCMCGCMYFFTWSSQADD